MRVADSRELHREVKNEMGIDNPVFIKEDPESAEEARYTEFGVGDYDINDDDYFDSG